MFLCQFCLVKSISHLKHVANNLSKKGNVWATWWAFSGSCKRCAPIYSRHVDHNNDSWPNHVPMLTREGQYKGDTCLYRTCMHTNNTKFHVDRPQTTNHRATRGSIKHMAKCHVSAMWLQVISDECQIITSDHWPSDMWHLRRTPRHHLKKSYGDMFR